MPSDSSWDRGYASLLSAAEAVPYACPDAFGPAGRYQLVELAAITTKSWIYRATDQSFASDGEAPVVAIKISRLQNQPSEAFLGRRVDHEGVVRLMDHGLTPEGYSYVVMEWIDGGDLASGEVPWTPRDAARFCAKLARTVQAAHGVLVIHCDLKPSNVLLTREREPRLADFDLAQRASDSNSIRKGTLAYMAPEQYKGLPGSHSVQADVYALGGILYFLVVGRAPHGDDAAVIADHLTRGVIPECAGIDHDLAGILRRAFSPDLAVRYETAHQFAVDLERWLDHLPLEWQAPGPVRRIRLWSRRNRAMAVALCALLVGTMVAGVARAEWVRREKIRDAEVVTQSDAKAQQKYDSASSLVRGMLVQAGRMLTAERRNQMNNEELLASLTVMQWLDTPPPGRTGNASDSLHQYGVDVWTEVLNRSEQRGAGSDTLTLFAHINLARLALSSRDLPLALKHVEQAERQWGGKLAEGDTAGLVLKVLRAILTKEGVASGTSAPAASAAALAALEAEATKAGIGESLLRHLRPTPGKPKTQTAGR